MKRLFNDHHPQRQVKSFKYAFQGVFHALINEPNFRIQLVIVFLSVLFGIKFAISTTEWGLLILSLGFLLSAEMVNTVVENFIDVLIQGQHAGAKIIKDVSAGFVLITAITALLIFFLIFGKHLIGLFY